MPSSILIAVLLAQAQYRPERTEKEFARHELTAEFSIVAVWTDLRPFEPEIELRILRPDGALALTLEKFAIPMGHDRTPQFEFFGGHLYVHWFVDSAYWTSWKYPFATSPLVAGKRIEYRRAAFRDPASEPGAITFYAESRDRSWNARVTPTEPRGFDYRATERREPKERHRPDPIDLPSGERVWIRENPGRCCRYGVLWLTPRRKETFYPMPDSPPVLLRSPQCEPGEAVIEPYIEHSALRGGVLWFAPTFEGTGCSSGAGAIGSFDIVTKQYTMKYPREIACCSASAMLLDGDTLWIGLEHNDAGIRTGKGLLAYDIKSDSAAVYPVSEYIHGIGRSGDRIYAATSHGLFELDRKRRRLVQLRQEPDERGWMHVVEKTLPLQ
jgi:hypothetical protein